MISPSVETTHLPYFPLVSILPSGTKLLSQVFSALSALLNTSHLFEAHFFPSIPLALAVCSLKP